MSHHNISNPAWGGGMVVLDVWPVISCQLLLDTCPCLKTSITAGLSTIPSRRIWAQWEWTVALLLTKTVLSPGHTLILVAAFFHCYSGSPCPGGLHTREGSLAHPQACPPPQVLFLAGNCIVVLTPCFDDFPL